MENDVELELERSDVENNNLWERYIGVGVYIEGRIFLFVNGIWFDVMS